MRRESAVRLASLVALASLLSLPAAGEDVLDRLTCLTQAAFRTDETSGVRYLEIAETRLAMAMTDFLPVTAGKVYRLQLLRHGPPRANIDVKVLLYDEDLHLIREGEYPREWNVSGQTVYSSWSDEAMRRNWRTCTMPEGAAFVRLAVWSERLARVASLAWEEVGDEPRPPARPLPESPYEVVVPTRASEPIAFAASELRHWIRRISGKRVALARADGVQAGAKRRIYLGRDFLPVETGPNDSWRLARRGDDVFLTASRDEGVCNAVYDLLERNSDLVFARSERDPGGVVFTPDPNLAFTNCTSHVVPAFATREFGFVGLHFDPATQLWCRRNYQNGRGAYYQKWHIASSAMTVFRRGLTYEYGRLIPNETYFKTHPEFYGMREEVRRPYEHYGVQPCYTCEAGRREIARNLIAAIRRDRTPDVTSVRVDYGDTWDLCRCPDCVRPVTLPSGRVLTEDDPAFRSHQFYRFAFAVAAEVARAFPGLRYESGGYLYSAVPPPELTFPRNYAVTFCPYPKICRVPVYDETHNARWRAASEGWGKSGALLNIYEYYGDAIGWPRPGCDNAAKDMAWWLGVGFGNSMYCEMPPDSRAEAVRNKGGYAASWDLSAMENWVMSRLFVDPTRDVQALRREFCRRAFRAAAPEMLAFYAQVHARWYANPRYQGWGENPVQSMNEDIRAHKLEKPLRELLLKAQAKADHPASKALVGEALAQWDALVTAAERAAPPPAEIPYAKVAGDALPGFADDVWRTGLPVTNFTCALVRGTTNLGVRTVARAFHDNRFLYVRFQCEGGAADARRGGRAAAGTDAETMRDGDSVGVFVRPGKDLNVYTQYRVFPDGARHDARGYDGRWGAEGFRAAADAGARAWRAVLRIPLAAAGVNPTVPGETRLAFVRSAGKGEAWRSYTSTGKPPHATGAYKPYVIEAK